MEGDMIALRDISFSTAAASTKTARCGGVFHSTGHPRISPTGLATAGCRLSPALFESRMEV